MTNFKYFNNNLNGIFLVEEVSLSRAAEIAGKDIESFKETLKMRGLKVSTYIGSKEDIEKEKTYF